MVFPIPNLWTLWDLSFLSYDADRQTYRRDSNIQPNDSLSVWVINAIDWVIKLLLAADECHMPGISDISHYVTLRSRQISPVLEMGLLQRCEPLMSQPRRNYDVGCKTGRTSKALNPTIDTPLCYLPMQRPAVIIKATFTLCTVLSDALNFMTVVVVRNISNWQRPALTLHLLPHVRRLYRAFGAKPQTLTHPQFFLPTCSTWASL